jgi:hypothetical protein
MKYMRITTLFLLIFLLLPALSQDLSKKNSSDSLSLNPSQKDSLASKVKSPNSRYELFISVNIGGDPEAYTAFGMSLAFHIAPIIDVRAGMDGYIGNDYGDGIKQKYNAVYGGLYIGQYVYKDKVRTMVGGGAAYLIRKLNDDDKRIHPFVNLKGEYYFNKNFGLGAEIKYYTKSIYPNSSALYYFNGNIRF